MGKTKRTDAAPPKKKPAGEAASSGKPAGSEAPPHGRWWLGPAALLTVFFTLGMIAWMVSGGQLGRLPGYELPASDIQLSTQPPWIKSNVKADVLRRAGLPERLSILDPQTAEDVGAAFALHPWVAEVRQVAVRYPAEITVEVRYREPVLMVEVPRGLYPVSVDAVLLPSGDFSPIEAARYPRLADPGSIPAGPVGSPWGDRRIEQAAEVGALLTELWPEGRLERLELAPRDVLDAPDAPAQFLLVGRGGLSARWGHAPGFESDDEAPPEAKLARLRKLLAQDPPPQGLIDLRSATAGQ